MTEKDQIINDRKITSMVGKMPNSGQALLLDFLLSDLFNFDEAQNLVYAFTIEFQDEVPKVISDKKVDEALGIIADKAKKLHI